MSMRFLPRRLPLTAGRIPRLVNSSSRAGRSAGGSHHVSLLAAITKKKKKEKLAQKKTGSPLPAAILFGTLFIWLLYPSDAFNQLSDTRANHPRRKPLDKDPPTGEEVQSEEDGESIASSAWARFASNFEGFSDTADIEWSALSDKIVGLILPEWSKLVPGYIRKLQRELSMAPGSLADEIWREAHDPYVNPEVRYSASVRVSSELCDEEKEFLARRKRVTKVALARYLDIDEKDIHPDDVPVIAMCGSGGGLRALVAGSGSLLAADEDGLFDCVTYTSGVSGSCWLQMLYFSTIGERNLSRVIDHLKARAGVHIAYPPVAFQALVSAPTSKTLLSGLVEKLRGDPQADFGLVDIYGLLLAARFLVPKGELGVNDRDFKLSNQRSYIKFGQNPLPIYTAVRHEIPGTTESETGHTSPASESEKEKAKQEAWFQWFEITPYEFFCEEFAAGIPTWAVGRKFTNGTDVPPEDEFHLPEVRMPFLMGVFGSAFCATLSHYYREIRPLVRSLSGFAPLDEAISGKYNDDLSKVHPIDPGTVANFVHGMHGKLPDTAPQGIYDKEYIQLMDAGMSNNLPIYPLLRPGRGVEILVAFDASADIKTDNWLAVADGYARKRGIQGWPVGIGWPQQGEKPAQLAEDLDQADAPSAEEEANAKLKEAQRNQQQAINSGNNTSASDSDSQSESESETDPAAAKYLPGDPAKGDLGYCTVWVGKKRERSSSSSPPPPASKALTTSTTWQLMEPDAGVAVIYLPFLANPSLVPDVNPGTSDFLSTWNFVYKPEQVEQVVSLARANFGEGRRQIRETVRAVYLRKKMLREEREEEARKERYQRLMRRGMATRLGEGDHFS